MKMDIKGDTPGNEEKTACVVFAHGCPRGMVDAATIVEYLKANGWSVTSRIGDASLILLHACGGDDFAEEKSMVLLSIANMKMKRGARMVVFGCLPGINGARIRERFDVIALPPARLGELDAVIGAKVGIGEIRQPNMLCDYNEQYANCFSRLERTYAKLCLSKKFLNKSLLHLLRSRGPARLSMGYGNIFEIKVVQGCLGNCSYCAIRFGEGGLVSKPIARVLDEFNSGIASGHKVFRLIGGDVGAYGQDIGTNVAEMLGNLFGVREDIKFIWDDFGPNWLIQYYPEISRILAENRGNIGYLGFPTQTGSDRILGLMKRAYTVDDIRYCLTSLKRAIPGIDLTTHIIVGFPGEKEKDFSMTLDFMKDIKFRQAEVFKYSDRPNTEASRMDNKVHELVKNMRVWRLRFKSPDVCVLG